MSAREVGWRNDWIEQTTTRLVREFDPIAVEDLQVKNMVRSAAGTVEEPGTNAANNINAAGHAAPGRGGSYGRATTLTATGGSATIGAVIVAVHERGGNVAVDDHGEDGAHTRARARAPYA